MFFVLLVAIDCLFFYYQQKQTKQAENDVPDGANDDDDDVASASVGGAAASTLSPTSIFNLRYDDLITIDFRMVIIIIDLKNVHPIGGRMLFVFVFV